MSHYDNEDEIDERALELRRALNGNKRMSDDAQLDEAVAKTVEKSKEIADKSKAMGKSAFGKLSWLFAKSKTSKTKEAVVQVKTASPKVIDEQPETAPEVAIAVDNQPADEQVQTLEQSVEQSEANDIQAKAPEDDSPIASVMKQMKNEEDFIAEIQERVNEQASVPGVPKSFYESVSVEADWDEPEPKGTAAVQTPSPTAPITHSEPSPVIQDMPEAEPVAAEEEEPITEGMDDSEPAAGPTPVRRTGLIVCGVVAVLALVGGGVAWHLYGSTDSVEQPMIDATMQEPVTVQTPPVASEPKVTQAMPVVPVKQEPVKGEAIPEPVKATPKPEPKHEVEMVPTPKAASTPSPATQPKQKKPSQQAQRKPKDETNSWQDKATSDLDKWAEKL